MKKIYILKKYPRNIREINEAAATKPHNCAVILLSQERLANYVTRLKIIQYSKRQQNVNQKG